MRIMTVTGEITPKQAGLTSIHEHVLANMELMEGVPIPEQMLSLRPENMAFLRNGASVFSKECMILNDVEYAAAEMAAFKQRVGGGTICEASPIGMRGDIRLLQEASERSDVSLVCSTGLYLLNRHPKELLDRDETFLAGVFAKEIEEGIDGTKIRPGFVKCALGTLNKAGNGLHERELVSLRACAKTAAKYGMSLHIHTAAPLTKKMILEAVDIVLEECSLSPDRLVMLHMDSFLRSSEELMKYVSGEHVGRKISLELPLEVLKKGANIGFDSWGTPFTSVLPDDFDRAKGLIELLRRGYEDHIVLGHDVISKAAGITTGYYGFTRFAEFVPSMLKPAGFGDNVIRKLMVDNPARILAC